MLIGIIAWMWVSQTMSDYYAQRDPKLKQILQDLSPVHPDIKNHTSLYEGKKSYTINKQKIYLCIKDENGNYYPDNSLYFVFLHEFAHKLNKTIGHGEDWEEIFQNLLKRAVKLGLYDPTRPPSDTYCTYNDLDK